MPANAPRVARAKSERARSSADHVPRSPSSPSRGFENTKRTFRGDSHITAWPPARTHETASAMNGSRKLRTTGLVMRVAGIARRDTVARLATAPRHVRDHPRPGSRSSLPTTWPWGALSKNRPLWEHQKATAGLNGRKPPIGDPAAAARLLTLGAFPYAQRRWRVQRE